MDFITLAAAKKYAKDIQPFKENVPLKSFYWDGDTTNLPFVDFGMPDGIKFTWYKISDEILSEKEVMKSVIAVLTPEGVISANTEIMTEIKTDNGGFVATSSQLEYFPFIIVCRVDGDKFSGTVEGSEVEVIFPEAGLWFGRMSIGNEGARALFLNTQPDITAIDSKFLPEGCAGREFGDSIYWDGSLTDIQAELGMHIEWDGIDTEVFAIVPSQSEEMEIPEGTAFYKVSDKIDTIIGKTFRYEFITGTDTSAQITTETVMQLVDIDSGDIIGEAGRLQTDAYCVVNLEKAGKINYLDIEIEFLEEGLYFIKVPGQGRVSDIYDELYNDMGGLYICKIMEALEDDLLYSTLEIEADGFAGDFPIIEYSEDNAGLQLGYYGKTETDSSYFFPFVFNIKTDNEIVDFSDFMEIEGYKFQFKKTGLYMINLFNQSDVDLGYYLLKGKNYSRQKISPRFLPDAWTVTDSVGSSSSPVSAYGVYKALGNRSRIPETSEVQLYNYQLVTSHGVALKFKDYYNKYEIDSLIQNLTNEINNLKNKISELET